MGPVTQAGLICLAMNVYHEARSEPTLGQAAVAEVTMNRVESDRYPDNVCDVVWQRKQFSWTHDGKSDKPKNAEAWAKAQRIALMVASSRDVTFVDQRMTHYHANYASPYWAESYEKVAVVGAHIFYKKRG